VITINEDAVRQINDDAKSSFPNECCGFLYGFEEGNKRFITKILRVNNTSDDDQRRRFAIKPADYILAENFAEENNLSLLGIYHSHPDHPAIPSETDRLSAQPYFSYVIVSIMKGVIGNTTSWQLNEQRLFEEEQINEFTTAY
jgi:proteasome lid subunit RPN8/RPN11